MHLLHGLPRLKVPSFYLLNKCPDLPNVKKDGKKYQLWPVESTSYRTNFQSLRMFKSNTKQRDKKKT